MYLFFYQKNTYDTNKKNTDIRGRLHTSNNEKNTSRLKLANKT